MLLRRYGINTAINNKLVYPGTLNAWLASNGGYTRGSEVIEWWDVNEYSKPAPGGTDISPRVTYDADAKVNIAGSGCLYAGTSGDICATYTKNIDQYICDGTPVILRVNRLDTGNSHFILAESQMSVGNTTTISILDPNRPNDDSRLDLLAYSNYFTGYRIYTGDVETTNPASIVVYMGSPAEMLIIDPQGRKTGWDPVTGAIINEIPGSDYYLETFEDKENWLLYVTQPMAGIYKIEVLGTGNGPFTVEMNTYDSKANKHTGLFEGYVSADRTFLYQIDYSSAVGSPSSIDPATYNFSGFNPPLSDDNNIFKLRRTIPIKFTITRNDGQSHSNIVANLTLQHIDGAVPIGEPVEPNAPGEANVDGYFRYDLDSDQYIYNLSTKDLTTGTWEITVHLDDGSIQKTLFGLK